MKINTQKNLKTLATMIALLLISSMAISLTAIPSANAHTPPWTISTYAYIVVSPDLVGVGQTAYVNFWLDKVPPTATGPWGMMWHNFKVNVTDPDGVTKDLGTFSSDPVGGAYTQFVPDKVGTYTFHFGFPGQVVQLENPNPYGTTGSLQFINDTYTGSSASTTLTVQEQPVQTAYPGNPLPSEYWTRPVSSMNREWYSISGNWLGLGNSFFANTGVYDSNNGNFNPYTEAPNSAHVLWTKPVAFGGQIGGEFGPDDTSLYWHGTAFENKFGAVIINGVLYYTQYPGTASSRGPLTAVDLRTGQTLWTVNDSKPLRCGMILNFPSSGNMYGGFPYIFTGAQSQAMGGGGSTWSMYDAMTGKWLLDIANVTAGTLVQGPQGELLSYRVANNQLTLWNISLCIDATLGPAVQPSWRIPQGYTLDWKLGNQWTVAVANNISGTPMAPYSLGISKVSDDVVLLTAIDTSTPGWSQPGWRVDAGYSAVDGHLIWGPVNRTLTPWTVVTVGPAGDGVYTEYTSNTMTWAGYDIQTGKKLWGPTQPYNSSWGYYDTATPRGVIGYGNLYTWSMSGEVHAYDIKTGAVNWSWSTGTSGIDTPYGTWPLGTWSMQHILADGKLYVSAGHDYTPPVFKGAKLYCINATNGELIWDSFNFNVVSSPAIADGIMLWFNGYDNQIYAYGKGASKTTVTAPAVGVTTNTPITISGTITDIADGTSQDLVAKNFPNGLPCISDASQSQFMEAVYQQQSMPTNLTGVPVTINVVDSNGNYRTIGTAVSNAYGTYSLTWTPDISGDYTVIANFAGTNSYYPSEAAAAFHAGEPASTNSPQPTQAPSMADLYFMPMSIAILIAIVIVGVIIVLVLRKRP